MSSTLLTDINEVYTCSHAIYEQIQYSLNNTTGL